MTDTLDVAALRRQSLDGFRDDARAYFEKHPETRSLVLAVSQYFADEAGDAVHEHVYAFPTKEPWWPHRCGDEEAGGGDGAKCSGCEWDELPHGTLDSNTDAVFAWSACCTEWGGGEGDPSLGAPVAIARRADDGQVDLELVHELVRPWMDTNAVGTLREEENWDEEPLPPAPEPARAPWTADEARMVDAVLAHPLDDGPRRVLVDYWLEQGDVRGEFGALSFEPPSSPTARRRHDALVAAHGRAWVGPLQPFIALGAARFGRGPFVQAAVVSWNQADARPEDVAKWALLEEVHFTGERHPVSRHQRGLRRAFGLTASTVLAMTEVGVEARLDTVGLAAPVSAGTWAKCPALQQVRRLEYHGAGDVGELAALPCWGALESVEVWLPAADDGYDAPQAWADGRGVAVLRALTPKLAAGTRLVVGYLFENGAKGGVVAVATAEGVALEDRRFASAEARRNAQARLGEVAARSDSVPAAPSTPAPSAAAAAVSSAAGRPPTKPGFFSRLFGRKP